MTDTTPPPVATEREAFEATFERLFGKRPTRDEFPREDGYYYSAVDRAWQLWQARAALSAPAAAPVTDEQSCTCHPDDNPPKPCAKKYAYSECVAASGDEALMRLALEALENSVPLRHRNEQPPFDELREKHSRAADAIRARLEGTKT
jgi:hypothetical protein